MLIIDNCKIFAESGKVTKFAALELIKYLSKMGINAALCENIIEATIIIASPYFVLKFGCATNFNDDGFAIKNCNNKLILTGGEERGVLYAVYKMLETLGCRWLFPGKDGEFIPKCDKIMWESDIEESPSFAIRGFTYDGEKPQNDVWIEELESTIDWMCKNYANSFFVHGDPYHKKLFRLNEIGYALKKRGLLFEIGGHGVHHLVERSLLETQPELFREVDGVRVSDGNFCSANPKAVKMAIDGVLELADEYASVDVDVIHLWFDDSMGGSWCNCDKCKCFTPQEQQLSVVNAIARELKQKYPKLKVDMLMYHDTLDMSKLAMQPESNVYGFFAPRERCRSHSIGNIHCKKNVASYKALHGTINKFKSNTYVFEYYADFILFIQHGICIPTVISQDIKDYLDAGANKISALMFGRYSWWAYPINMYVYSRTAFNVNFDVNQAIDDFCRLQFGNSSNSMKEYYRNYEAASVNLLSFCEYDDTISDLRNIPPQSPEFYRSHLDGILKTIDYFKKAYDIVDNEYENSDESIRKYLLREKLIMEISHYESKAVYYQMLARYLFYVNGDRAALEENMDKSIALRMENKERMSKVPSELVGISGPMSCGYFDNMTDWQRKMRVNG